MSIDLLAILLILSLATFGLTDLLTKQNGPAHLFKRWRQYLKRNQPEIADSNEDNEAWELYNRLYDAWERSGSGQLSELFECSFCLGVWVSGFLVFAYTGTDWYSFAYWMAVYGLHSAIVKVVE